MGLLVIIILLVLVLLSNLFLVLILMNIKKWLSLLSEPPMKPTEPMVTDPFSKPKPVHSSTAHIIVPKTPVEIRNENFKKIKDGIEYGDISRG